MTRLLQPRSGCCRESFFAKEFSIVPFIPMTDLPQKTDEKEDLFEERWMIRPCDLYKEEYDDCTCFKARFNQYFIYGKTIDCSQWKKDYESCRQWATNVDPKAYKELVDSEKKRRFARLKPHFDNNVWKKREKPPEDWNKPLPDWMQEAHKDTYLNLKAQELAENKEDEKRTLCTIS